MSRAEFEANMAGKMRDPVFYGDLDPLVALGTLRYAAAGPDTWYRLVHDAFITRLHGDAWKGER